MPHKRKPFFIKGNFQLKFILCFIFILVFSTGLAALLIFRLSADVIERAAFSSHLSFGNSGELVGRIILEANVKAGLFCVLSGLLMIGLMHFYLGIFFRTLANHLRDLGAGKFSPPLKGPCVLPGRFLVEQYNRLAEERSSGLAAINKIVSKSLLAMEAETPAGMEELESLAEELSRAVCP
jgi:hypothetical protein